MDITTLAMCLSKLSALASDTETSISGITSDISDINTALNAKLNFTTYKESTVSWAATECDEIAAHALDLLDTNIDNHSTEVTTISGGTAYMGMVLCKRAYNYYTGLLLSLGNDMVVYRFSNWNTKRSIYKITVK